MNLPAGLGFAAPAGGGGGGWKVKGAGAGIGGLASREPSESRDSSTCPTESWLQTAFPALGCDAEVSSGAP